MQWKKKLLSTSLILGLLFQPFVSVQANDEVSEEITPVEAKNLIETNLSEETLNQASFREEIQEQLNKIKALFNEEQQRAIDSLYNSEDLGKLLAEGVQNHEAGDFALASSTYENMLTYNEISVEEIELLETFKRLADNNRLLTEYEAAQDAEENSAKAELEAKQSMEVSEIGISETEEEKSDESDNQEVDVEDESSKNESPPIEIVSEQNVNYRGYLVDTSEAIMDYPGGEIVQSIAELVGYEVKIQIEADASDNTTWFYVEVVGTDVTGWVVTAAVEEEAVSNTTNLSYRGYLTRSNDTLNTQPWGTKGYEEIRRVQDLRGREVEVLQEAVTQRATWLYVHIRGTDVSGWIDKAGIAAETISNSKNAKYRGYLSRSTDTINTRPWGTPGYEEIRHVTDLKGREVEVQKEATTQRATWLYVRVRGTNIEGWVDKNGVDIESTSNQQSVKYRGYLSRSTDTVNTRPWGTPGYEEIRHVADLVGREVEVKKEATTQRATWLYVHVRGTNIEGWVDRAGVKAESITSQKNVNYRGYLSRRNDTINTLPWGVRGFKEVRRVTNLQGREVKVTREAVTPRATWLHIEVVGTNVSGWIDKAGITPERISSQKNVNYQAVLSRSSDSINTQPWGTIGNRVIRQVNSLVNRKVNVTREAKTQRATWAFVTIPGTNISGWVDKAGLRENILIYLDPGHGGGNRNGGNPGAVYNGVREQDLNLNISLQVRDRLEKLGYQVVMSRENDNNSYHNNWRDDLFARPAHANRIGADLLVSIHHNASGTWDSSMNGIETYVYGVNSEYPPLPENRNSHNDPQRMSESRKLANAVHKELLKNTGARDRGVQSGAFIVVREAKMPAVLLELGFMSNRAELNKLTTTSYQQRLVNGIVTGVHNYFLI